MTIVVMTDRFPVVGDYVSFEYNPIGDSLIVSMGISIVTVLVLAITRAAYATSVAFILMTIKGLLLLKREKT